MMEQLLELISDYEAIAEEGHYYLEGNTDELSVYIGATVKPTNDKSKIIKEALNSIDGDLLESFNGALVDAVEKIKGLKYPYCHIEGCEGMASNNISIDKEIVKVCYECYWQKENK